LTIKITHTRPYKDAWITPEEQLKRLHRPLADAISAFRSELVPDIANIVAQYASSDRNLFVWYTSLKTFQILPERIPPLPETILLVLKRACPIHGEEFTVSSTHTLLLISEMTGTLNQWEKDVLEPDGNTQHPKDEKPFQFRYFYDNARRQYGDIPYPPARWVLITNAVLPGSLGLADDQALKMVQSLNERTDLNYKVASLQEMVAAIFLNRVVGESLYHHDASDILPIFTRLEETVEYTSTQGVTENYRLIVGGLSSNGLCITIPKIMSVFERTGIAAVCELYEV
jgi:hypothetical protein